jgi:hypothetical protein
MPVMTAIPLAPLERPGLEVQAGIVPGYYLSATVREKPEAAAIPQLAALLEPDELLHVPGLFAGARYAGEASEGAALEPLIGYRTYLDDDKRFSLAGVGFIAYASGEDGAASFSALRGGAEAGVDARLTPSSKFIELHANLGATLTALDAHGTYCVGVDGRFGVDCAAPPPEPMPIAGSASGIFPTGHAGVSVDFARHLRAAFHGVRLAVDGALGTMPTVVSGEQQSAKWYGAAGLSLTLGFGASHRAAAGEQP